MTSVALLPRGHRWVLVVFLVVALASVLGNSVGPDVVGTAATPLLLPLLVLWVVLSRGARSPRLLIAGMLLAWLGDVSLDGPGDTRFLVGIGFFLGMQICYSLGFIRLGALRRLATRPYVPLGALALWVVLNVALGPSMGDMRWPIAIYSAFLFAMATLSLGVSQRVGIGGVLFLASDLLIGLDAAGIDFAGRGAIVMATYALGQLLIVTGWMALLDTSSSELVHAAPADA